MAESSELRNFMRILLAGCAGGLVGMILAVIVVSIIHPGMWAGIIGAICGGGGALSGLYYGINRW